ncbi:inositol monophosphatase [Microtetraspora sp. NBRC 13810]|uniref:inositol monophosphatase family protein n=1 Tax=Microtetraspora sp. NBRC 13810 TaxID=3030990 RepID=UPI0024A0399E|nr:inositol monophosphatase family protein [Microtetraspora sp. NBRC 13810]GLW10067.1 inositol monophosphatase [Microtetraspora sp. NBRC 13810]
MTLDARTLLPIAEHAVTIASQIVTTRLPGAVTAKGDRDMATEVDFAVEDALRDFLTRETPEIGVLGEEEGLTNQGGNGLTWALDPIDGTVNFMHGLPMCGTSLGLLDGDVPVLGVIELPFLGERYTAADGTGSRLNGEPIAVAGAERLSSVVVAIGDYAVGPDAETVNGRRLVLARTLAGKVQRLRMLGSAATALAWIAAGRIDATVLYTNKPWDTAAGAVIAREAGAAVADFDGTPHTMRSAATLAANPAVLAGLLDLARPVFPPDGQGDGAAPSSPGAPLSPSKPLLS